MTVFNEDELSECLSKVLLEGDNDLDEDLITYLVGMICDEDTVSIVEIAKCTVDEESEIFETIGPFLESSGCEDDMILKTCVAVQDLAKKYHNPDSSSSQNEKSADVAKKLKQGMVSMSSNLEQKTEEEEDANRFLWGTDSGVAAFVNDQKNAHDSTQSAKEKRKSKQELERARKEYQSRLEALEREEEKEGKNAVVSQMVLPDYDTGRNEKDIQCRNVSISLDNGRILLENANLKFAHQRRYGLVGKNGIGKTTLLKAIASMEIEGFPRHHRVLHVRQEVKSAGTELSVLQSVLQSDAERNALLEQEKEVLARLEGDEAINGDSSDAPSVTKKREELNKRLQEGADGDGADADFNEDLRQLDKIYARLDQLSSDSAESRAAVILSGLQFTTEMQNGPTSALSGGWRMRVSLAASLFIEPDLLLLDEPTNHLDLEAVLWLESYLCEYRHTVVVVSHDRGFLNEVCTDVVEFKNKKLNYYKGNYDTYVKTSTEAVKNQMRVYQAYQDKRAHMMEFIEKFRANAKRASIVQSRIKAVEKMDLEAPEQVEIEAVWRFSIPNPEPLGRPIIAIDDVSFDYKPKERKLSEYILKDVNFGVDLDSRIGILGANGAGKSTLLNLITDKLQPLSGSVSRNGRLRIGMFTQHSADKFDLHLSAVENMLILFPDSDDQQMRSFIGKFQIQGDEAVKPMLMLSGGQKSRIAFASLAYQRPHVIIMDEPTNHLDMESIDALVEAVKDFRGGLMVVSHDQHFITNTCRDLWVVGGGEAARFRGGFEDYKAETLKRTAKRVAQSVKSLSNINQ